MGFRCLRNGHVRTGLRAVRMVVAVGLALAVGSCALPSLPSSTSPTLTASPQRPTVGVYAKASYERGFILSPNSPTDYGSDLTRDALAEIHGLGANAVTFTTSYVLDSPTASVLHPGSFTATDAALATGIARAKELGMRVTVALYVDRADGQWRARLYPQSRDSWFAHYGDILNHLAVLSARAGADSLCIGEELISLTTYTSNPDNTERWRKLIAGVRARFHGRVIYAANWGGSQGFGEEYHHIGFWDAVDVVGIDAYYPLVTELGASVASIEASWGTIHDTILVPFAQQVRRPILFTEVGYRSIPNAAVFPPWPFGGPYDECAQTQAYFALLDAWKQSELLSGIYWHDWDVSPQAGGPGDTTFSPRHKAAEAVVSSFWGGVAPVAERERMAQCIGATI